MTTPRIARAFVTVAMFVTLPAGCTVQPGSGGNQRVQPETEIPEVSDQGGFFGPTEAWSAASEQFIGAGFGTQFEFLAISEPGAAANCLGIEPMSDVRFDGDQVQFLADYNGVETGQACELAATGNGTACAPPVAGALPGLCEISEATGFTTFGGSATTLDRVAITRFAACDDRLTTLTEIEDWVLFNVHPFSVFLVNDPADVGGVVVIAGARDQVTATAIATSADPTGNTECQDQNPDGSVSFDRETLDVDLETAGGCTIQFTGQPLYCAELDPAAFGDTGARSVIIRVEGSGQYNSPDGNGAMEVMYLGFGGNTQIPIRQ